MKRTAEQEGGLESPTLHTPVAHVRVRDGDTSKSKEQDGGLSGHSEDDGNQHW